MRGLTRHQPISVVDGVNGLDRAQHRFEVATTVVPPRESVFCDDAANLIIDV
jgi:hypothetical protein